MGLVTSNRQRLRPVRPDSYMKPPADRRLDASGAGSDLPAPARPRYGLRYPLVFGVATLLGILSSALAVQFTRALGKPISDWTYIVALNCA